MFSQLAVNVRMETITLALSSIKQFGWIYFRAIEKEFGGALNKITMNHDDVHVPIYFATTVYIIAWF